jgi:hypothetical protein
MRGLGRFLATVSFLGVSAAALAGGVPNWPAPAAWTPAGSKGLLAEVSNPLPFEPVTPCRVADTRGNGFTGGYGPPSLASFSTRNFTITGQCGIPVTARAVSFQFTVTGMGANGNLVAFPQGGAQPTSSVLNWNASSVAIGNGTVVALSSAGGLSIFSNSPSSVELIIDVNGYYYDAFLGGVGNLPSGRFFGITSDVPGGSNGAGVIIGHNTESISANSWGGEFLTDSCNAGSAGVFGQAYPSSACGAVFGVWGRTNSNSASSSGVLGEATGATTTSVYGVQGTTTGSGIFGAGVYGIATNAANNGGKFYNVAGSVTTYLATSSGGTAYSLIGTGTVLASGLNITGAKNFISPHPLDPSKEIRYASVEAPTVDVYFRGTASLVNGSALIEIPEHFRLTAREGTYMTTLTSVGRASALSVESEGADGIVVRGSGSGRFHFVVYAERAEIEGYEPVIANVHFTPEALERGGLIDALPAATKAILVRNGTLKADGSYDAGTARALGWKIPDSRDGDAPR